MTTSSERDVLLRSFTEYRQALAEAKELLALTPDDAETQTYVDEIAEALTGLAKQLNETDDIQLEKMQHVREHRCAQTGDIVSRTIAGHATYEVLFDDTTWYSCAVLDVVPAASPVERQQYRVAILGYPDVEVVDREALRLWKPPSEVIAAKKMCHALCDKEEGRFKPCVVDRVSPNGTVVVTFSDGSTSAGTSTEIPISHIRTGKVYRSLMKRNKDISDEERKAKNAARKRERNDQRKQMMSDLAAQDSSDWQHLLDSVTAGSAPKVARKDR